MNKHWIALLFAALSMTATAQETTAAIPFDFTVSGQQLPAGDYILTRMRGSVNYVLVMRNAASGKALAAMARSEADRNLAEGRKGVLLFRCQSGGCSLAEVHTPGSSNARRFAAPAKKGAQERRVAIVFSSRASDGI